MAVAYVVGLLAVLGLAQGSPLTSEPAIIEEIRQDGGMARVVAGWEAAEGQIPHQVSIRMVNNAGGVSSCGGSIIHHQWVLTAAHCLANRLTFVVRFGVQNLTRPAFIVESDQKYIHPQYNEIQAGVQTDDIALLGLDRYIPYGPLVQPCRLQNSETKNKDYTDVVFTVSGFGLTDDRWNGGAASEVLRWVFLRGISNEECLSWYPTSTVIQDETICAAYYNDTAQSACSGDSGGPLTIVDVDNKLTMVGVVSFGSNAGCNSPFPGGYVRPGHYHQWYNDVTGLNFDWSSADIEPEVPEAPEVPETPEAPEAPEALDAPEAPEALEVPEGPEAFEVPVAPEALEVPETPETYEVPVDPETFDVPETPEAFEVPEAPEAFEVPEASEVFEVPEAPEAFEVPEAPAAFDVPEAPETYEVPVDPETFDVPKAPEVFEVPETPEAFEVPEAPEAFEVPEAPAAFEIPEAPEAYEVPVDPETFDVPKAPEVFEVPETPEAFEVPEAPEAFEVPEASEVFEVPEAPEAFEVPEAPEAFEVPEASEVFEVPEAHEAFEVPEAPEVFEVPEASEILYAPEYSVPFEVPDAPEAVENPDAFETEPIVIVANDEPSWLDIVYFN